VSEPTTGLFPLLAFLDEVRAHYRLRRNRPDTICVDVTIVGERIEIDVFEDGHLEISRFKGDESVESGSEAIEALFEQLREDMK
jgi:hypothetical protein